MTHTVVLLSLAPSLTLKIKEIDITLYFPLACSLDVDVGFHFIKREQEKNIITQLQNLTSKVIQFRFSKYSLTR